MTETTRRWFRIDKGNGQIAVAKIEYVRRAASEKFSQPADVIKAGRFNTPFAIYSREDQLTPDEADSEKTR